MISGAPECVLIPDNRGLHLISTHGYPKFYLFARINHGIGELLVRYSEGVTQIRKEWKSRPGGADGGIEAPGKSDSHDQSPHESDRRTDQFDDLDVDL